MEPIVDALKHVSIGPPAAWGNLAMFPLTGGGAKEAGYWTLQEALERECSEITEVSEGGSVPELRFVNSGDRPVFLLDGEQLVGAKQNRILNLSILVAGGKTVIIPVSCVEAGRWHHTSRFFSSDLGVHYAEGRARKMSQVSQSMRSSGKRASDQSQVWADIAEKSSRFGVHSSTSAMRDLYAQQEDRLGEYGRRFRALEGQRGAAFAISGKVVGLELFDAADTFTKLLPKLLRSYGLDALDSDGRGRAKSAAACTAGDVDAFVKRIVAARKEEFLAVGEGRDVRISGDGLTGAALAVDGQVVHLSAFALP